MIEENLAQMRSLTYGMDIIILSVTSPHEELFWQKRLDSMRGQVIKEHTRVLTVCEDWEGGAGNALGTLYAFLKANHKMQERYKRDLFDCLDQGDAIALYHTAGKGTRLAPITGCEYNSKSRIKLIGKLLEKGGSTPITLLEATLKQTALFAPKRRGRLSVFWGDQIFIPSNTIEESRHHVDLLVKTLPSTPTELDWQRECYSKYGLVIIDPDLAFKQLEKLSYSSFKTLSIKPKEKVGLSMGSFSLSKKILKALLEEFKPELELKKDRLDTDPHLWMPLSLDLQTYLAVFASKELSKSFAQSHYERMQQFKEQFSQQKLLGSTDLGHETLWWDYGNTAAYHENSLKITKDTEEGQVMRSFFSIPDNPENHVKNNQLKIENSTLINCSISKGTIKNSVLIDVIAEEANLEESVLIHTSAQKIDSKGAILYNVVENGPLHVEDNTIRADNFSKQNGHIKLHNSILSPIPWDQCAKENVFSFSSLHQINQGLHPSEGQQRAQTAHNQVKQAVINLQIQEKE